MSNFVDNVHKYAEFLEVPTKDYSGKITADAVARAFEKPSDAAIQNFRNYVFSCVCRQPSVDELTGIGERLIKIYIEDGLRIRVSIPLLSLFYTMSPHRVLEVFEDAVCTDADEVLFFNNPEFKFIDFDKFSAAMNKCCEKYVKMNRHYSLKRHLRPADCEVPLMHYNSVSELVMQALKEIDYNIHFDCVRAIVKAFANGKPYELFATLTASNDKIMSADVIGEDIFLYLNALQLKVDYVSGRRCSLISSIDCEQLDLWRPADRVMFGKDTRMVFTWLDIPNTVAAQILLKDGCKEQFKQEFKEEMTLNEMQMEMQEYADKHSLTLFDVIDNLVEAAPEHLKGKPLGIIVPEVWPLYKKAKKDTGEF